MRSPEPPTAGTGSPDAGGTHLLIRSGARSGLRIALRSSPSRLGRRDDLEIPLDPERDLEVSVLHAELVHRGGRWLLRDLGSRNGTFLNGRRVGAEPVPIAVGDELRLGAEGPLLELVSGVGAMGEGGAAPAAGEPGATVPAGGSATQRVRALVRRETRKLRGMVAILVLLLLGAGGAFLLHTARERAGWERERAELEARADSLLAAGDRASRSLEGELGELALALDRSRAELAEVRRAMEARAVAAPSASGPEREAADGDADLRERLRSATVALERQQLAASLDFEGIQEANRRAVAILFVERPDGTVATGTAFAVEAEGTMITSRHVVLGEEELERPLRLAVQFTDSPQVFPARLLAASTEWDLAAIAVENLEGGVPVVNALNARSDTLQSGAPLASIGFPLAGGSVAMGEGGARPVARPLLSAGVLLGRSTGTLEIQGYGEPGASGSPIFDRDGAVAGILYGGRREGDLRVLVAVPAAAVAPLLLAIAEGGG